MPSLCLGCCGVDIVFLCVVVMLDVCWFSYVLCASLGLVWLSFFVVYGLLSVVCCSVSVAWMVLVCCLLFDVCGLLFDVCCLLFEV